jgi:hypothetical protein
VEIQNYFQFFIFFAFTIFVSYNKKDYVKTGFTGLLVTLILLFVGQESQFHFPFFFIGFALVHFAFLLDFPENSHTFIIIDAILIIIGIIIFSFLTEFFAISYTWSITIILHAILGIIAFTQIFDKTSYRIIKIGAMIVVLSFLLSFSIFINEIIFFSAVFLYNIGLLITLFGAYWTKYFDDVNE